jgi:hypothetical protein
MLSTPLPMVNLGRLLVVFTVGLCSGILSAQQPDSTFWVPNGIVNTLLIHDTTLIIGGDFDLVSPVTGSFVRIDTTVPDVSATLPKVFGTVYATAVAQNGYVYVGGRFNRVANQSVSNLFRLKPDGTFDHSFNNAVAGTVYCLEVTDTVLYIGGEFADINGVQRNNFGAIDLITGATHICNPDVNGPVYCMDIDPNSFANAMIIGGDFTQVGTRSPRYLAKIGMDIGDVKGSGPGPWTAQPYADGPVFDVHVDETWVYIAGEFTQFIPIIRPGFAKLLKGNGTVQADDAQVNGPVYVMEFADSAIYIGGNFTSVGGQTRNNIAALETDLSLRQWWDIGTNGTVRVIYPLDKTRFFFGGDFTRLGNDTCGYGGIVYKATAHTKNWDPKFNHPVYTAVCDTFLRLYVGGEFYGAGSVPRNNLCAISLNTGRVTGWDPDVNAPVFTLTLDGDTLYFAGDFTATGGVSRGRIAGIDLSTATLLPFNPGVNGLVRSIAVTDSFVYAGGNYTVIGGQPRNNIGRVSKFTAQTSVWNPDCFGTANTVIATPGWIYVAGYYSNIGGYPRQNVARLHPHSGLADQSWICDTDDGVYHAALYNNQLVIGGWFTQVNAQNAAQFALFDITTMQLSPAAFSSDGYVRTFTQSGDDFFIAGTFQLAGPVYTPHLAAYDAGDNAIDTWAPFPSSMPLTMEATTTRLFVGGNTSFVGGRFHPNLQVLPIQWVTAVDEQSPVAASLNVYPNPASDQIAVQETGAYTHYTLTDVAGNVLQSGTITGTTLQLSVGAYDAGMYFLTVAGEDQQPVTQRIIKQ